MGKTKPRVTYQAVSLPSDFVEEVRRFVKGDDKYRSMAEFTREAVTEKMNREFMRRGVEAKSGKKIKPLNISLTQTADKIPVTDEVKRYIKDEVKAIFEKTLKEQKKKKVETNGNGHGLS